MKEEEIGRIAVVTSGNSAPQDSRVFENGIFPFVRTGDIGKVHRSKSFKHPADYLNEDGIKGLRLFPKGSILFPKSGASTLLNHRAILGEDSYVVSHLAVIIPNEDIVYPLYLYYATTAIDAGSIVDDRAYPSIKASAIAKLSIPLPPLSEQERIVSELDLLTEVIDKQKAQLKELDTLAQSIFYDMFGDPVLNDKGWECRSLKESVVEMFLGPFGSSLKTDCYVSAEQSFCMVYEQKHAIKKTLNVETHYIDKLKYDSLKRFEVRPGDFIMSCRGTIGEIYRLPSNAPIGIIHPSLMKIRIKEDVYNSSFFLWLLSKMIKNENTNGNCVQMAITAKELGTRKAILPPLSLQQSFADKVSAIEQQKAAIGCSIAETQQLFDYTMDKYFG